MEDTAFPIRGSRDLFPGAKRDPPATARPGLLVGGSGDSTGHEDLKGGQGPYCQRIG